MLTSDVSMVLLCVFGSKHITCSDNFHNSYSKPADDVILSVLVLQPKKPKQRLSTLTLSEVGLSRDWDFRMTCYQYLPCFSVKSSKKNLLDEGGPPSSPCLTRRGWNHLWSCLLFCKKGMLRTPPQLGFIFFFPRTHRRPPIDAEWSLGTMGERTPRFA